MSDHDGQWEAQEGRWSWAVLERDERTLSGWRDVAGLIPTEEKANLIAAAPEMGDMLRELLYGDEWDWSRAAAVLATAEGRTV